MIRLRNWRVSRGTGFAILILWAVAVATIWYLCGLAQEQLTAREQSQLEKTQNYSYLISQHFKHGFEKADILLQSAVDEYLAITNDGKYAEKRKEILRAYLKRRSEILPGIASFTIIRPNGRRLVGIVNKDDTDLSARPYFVAIKETGSETFITPVEDGQASGKNGIHIARRIPGKNGSFGGVIVINLSAKDVFYKYFTGLGFDEGNHLEMRSASKVYLEYPETYRKVAGLDEFISHALASAPKGGAIEFTSKGNDDLIIVYDRIDETGFYSVVMAPEVRLLRGENYFIPLPYIIAVATLLTTVFMTFLLLSWAQLQRAHKASLVAAKERQRLIKKLNTIAEEERKHIANDIHDVMNATLIAIKLDAHSIKQRLHTGLSKAGVISYLEERANAIESSAKDLYAYCRSIVAKLRPESLDIHGLPKALEELVTSFNARNFAKCKAVFQWSGVPEALNNEIAIALYRVAQESFSNIQKYSQASEVTVKLDIDTKARAVKLTIKDNGVGFSIKTSQGFGILSMKERIEAIGGTCSITGAPMAGVLVSATVPIIE